MYKKIITVISSLFIVISPVIVNSQTAGSNVKWLLEPVYERVTSFSEGLAFAIKKDNYSGLGSSVYIDKKGKEIVKGEFIDGDAFSEGIAKIHLITSNKKYSYIDKDGKLLTKSQFDDAKDFSEGLASVGFGEWKNYRLKGKYGFIDSSGTVVIEPRFDFAWDFSEGLAMIKIDGKSGFIDKTGRIIVDPQFDVVSEFSEGLAAVKKGGKWGYIDKTGKFVIEPQFDKAEIFCEGMASVGYGRWDGGWFTGKNGFIDKTGKVVIEPQFDYTWNFSEGLAPVCKDKKWGYIDKNGKMQIELQFEFAVRFSEGCARVKTNNREGFILNPLNMRDQEKSFSQSGQLIGDIKSVAANEVIVGGKNLGETVMMGDRLCIFTGDKIIILKSTFPMMTTAKCAVLTGSIRDIKKGMKVYKYTAGKKKKNE